MEYRSLGKSGLKVSAVGLGCNQFGGKVSADQVVEIVHAALDAGVNLIDTADVYQQGRSEEAIGRALQGRRQQAVIATKFRNKTGEGPNQGGASRLHLMNAVEASLRRLQTDTIDLYQIHRWDDETPVEETLRALDNLVQSGKVRYIGASYFTAWQLAWSLGLAQAHDWTAFVSIQAHYHLLERSIEKELIPACHYFNVGILPFFPLAGGFLTGKYKAGQPPPPGTRGETNEYVQRYFTPEDFSCIEKLAEFAEEHGHSLTELAHAWLLAQPQVASVISGATSVEQVTVNARANGWKLSPFDEAAVRQILECNRPAWQPA